MYVRCLTNQNTAIACVQGVRTMFVQSEHGYSVCTGQGAYIEGGETAIAVAIDV